MFKIIFERVLRLCTFHRPLCRPLRRPFCRPIHVICPHRPSSPEGLQKIIYSIRNHSELEKPRTTNGDLPTRKGHFYGENIV